MKRRTFLHQSAAATAGLASAPLLATADAPASRVIDTHVHFYDPTRPQGVPWPAKNSPLYRTVLPDDWAKVALPVGVTDVLIVEASEWVEDNQWTLDLAAKEKRIVGVAGNLDPLSPEFAANLKRFSSNPLFRGIRNRRPNATLSNIVDSPEFLASMKLMADAGLELDVNFGGGKGLDGVSKLATALPDLRIIIDHVGGSGDPRQLKDEWKTGMKVAGKLPNVWCKISALVEQTKDPYGQAPRETDFYRPILDHVYESFGDDRVVYASNWPVSDKGAPYDALFRIVKEYFTAKGRDVCEKFFWKNSLAAYRWIERG